jgi:UDP-N-acetylglucosamine--N-acetylmuramyl-(pentapeptide) pyrophosphoryl-undecaprenol N-acetylglucosamine transferase
MICAGGTGGHMFPAMALADDLISRGCKIVFVTDKRTKKYVEKRDDYNVQVITSSTLPSGLLGKVKGLLNLARGYFQSMSLIKKYNPSLAIGFGGYPSLPPMVAAQRQNIMTVIHEANAVLGRANAYLAPHADRIALSLPDMSSLRDEDIPRTVVTGNPVRSDIGALYAHSYNAPDADKDFNLLVIGGSLGAKVMGDNMPQALASLPEDLKVRLNVTQQCLEDDVESVKTIYNDAGITAKLSPFIENMPEILKTTHLAVARAGASTVAELAVAGVPAIYIPYPHHADQQQKVNAESISKQGGAWVIEEKDLTPSVLASRIESLMRSPESLFKAAESARGCAKPEATRKLGNLIIALIKGWD